MTVIAKSHESVSVGGTKVGRTKNQTIREKSMDLIFFVAKTIAVPEECSKMNQTLRHDRSSWCGRLHIHF